MTVYELPLSRCKSELLYMEKLLENNEHPENPMRGYLKADDCAKIQRTIAALKERIQILER